MTNSKTIDFLADPSQPSNAGFKVRYNEEVKLLSAIDLGQGLSGMNRDRANKSIRNLISNYSTLGQKIIKFKFSQNEKPTWTCDIDTAIELIMLWPGNRAVEMRLKFVECIKKHFLIGETIREKLNTLENMFQSLPPSKEFVGMEKWVVLELQKMLGGELEVGCDSGFIDLVTSTHIIEVKQINNWKHAIGQILSYSFDFPNHRKQIVLFGGNDVDNKKTINDVCDKYEIQVSYFFK